MWLLLLFHFSLSALAMDLCDYSEQVSSLARLILPVRTEINLHYLYKHVTQNSSRCNPGYIEVMGPSFSEDNVNDRGDAVTAKILASEVGNSMCLLESKFKQEVDWGKSVFRTKTGTGTNEASSFLVGKNIIMTNHHVVAPTSGSSSDCRAVEIKTNDSPEQVVKCKKILFCQDAKDLCFIEMEPTPDGKELGDLVPPMKLDCGSLKEQSATLIGNSNRYGIQASSAKILNEQKDGFFHHYIPLTGGASGSPVIGDDGLVKGINHSHSGEKSFVSTNLEDYNIGTSMRFTRKLVREELKLQEHLVRTSNGTSKFAAQKLADLKKVKAIFDSNPKCKEIKK